MSKLRIALIGCGGIHRKHVKTFLERQDECEIVALVDVKKEICERFAEANGLTGVNGGPQVFTSATDMYPQIQPDAVSICTPHTLHYQQCLEALDAECHILLEKPMVTAAEQAYDLHEKVRAAGRVLSVAYNTACKAEMAYIRDVIRNQTLGKLEVVSGYISQNWRRNTAGMWRQQPELSGGGMAYDSGAHPLNTLCWTVEQRIEQVHALVDNVGTPVDINSSMNIRFENGVFATMAISGNCPANGSFMTYLFDGGRIDVNPWQGDWIKIWQDSKELKYPSVSNEDVTPADNFLDAIAGKAEPAATTYNGIIHSELMDAIYESARTGQPARPAVRGDVVA